MKQQINFRASEYTANKLADLIQQTGMSQTEIITVAIEKFSQEINKMETNWCERAENRVNRSPELSKYRDIIFYDWPEGENHLKWITTAKVSEIVDWADRIKKDNE